MKKLLTTTLFLMVVLTLQATEVPQIANILGRQTTSLNGTWNYIVDVQEEGYYDYRMTPMRNGFFINAKPRHPEDLIEYDFDKAETMQIPGDWNTQDQQLFFYEGTVWLKRSFEFHPEAGRRTLLYFGAVNYDTHVYVNGQKAGHHQGGFTPFNYDVTDFLKDGENQVIVKVDNKRHPEDVPTQIFDWWNYGGITRDVLLVSVAPTYVENYKLQLDNTPAAKKGQRQISFCAKLNKAEAGQSLTLRIPELKINKQMTTTADGIASLTLNAKPQLWSPENPKLYKVEIQLGDETLSDEIGFRTIETRGKQILLNGEPIFLKGISIHEEKPNGGGRANSTEDAHTLLSWAKELGCNYVRLAHYPHNEYAVREAERMGILVWSEIPVYWTIAWSNPDTYANAKRQLSDMIARDQNRANVIIWSIANETPHSAKRDAFLGKLAKHARELDPTRLISMAMEVTGASNYHNILHDNMSDLVDVVSFNQYGLHGPKNQRWTEEFQENLYRENCAMLDKIDGLAGTTPWILKDFRSPRRVLTGIQDYYNRKGVFSDKGEKKLAFYVLRDWYKTK